MTSPAGFVERPEVLNNFPSGGAMEGDIFDWQKEKDTVDFKSFQGKSSFMRGLRK